MEQFNRTLRIAFVVPRYAEGLGGGAEALFLSLIGWLRDNPEHGIIPEVWTTCAVDHRTWRNELAAGSSEEGGVAVQRFPVDERDLEKFIHAEIALQQGRVLSLDEQLGWLDGGVNSHPLYEYIVSRQESIDLVVTGPYLFPISFWAIALSPGKGILLPCLHDEPYAYLDTTRYLIRAAHGMIFNSQPELLLAQKIIGAAGVSGRSVFDSGSNDESSSKAEENNALPPHCVVGMGFTPPRAHEGEGLPQRSVSTLIKHVPRLAKVIPPELAVPTMKYVLYSGRKERGKNLDLLISYFEIFTARHPEHPVALILMGSGTVDFRDALPSNVVDVGFVSEEEKGELLQHACCLCQPSQNESFSIVLMEAWSYLTPVIVHEECDVTRYHVEEAQGGLWFRNVNDFCGVVSELVCNPQLGAVLGQRGRDYVGSRYSWQAVGERLVRGLREMSANGVSK